MTSGTERAFQQIMMSRNASRFTTSQTAATRPVPIERALKTDILSIILAIPYALFNTN